MPNGWIGNYAYSRARLNPGKDAVVDLDTGINIPPQYSRFSAAVFLIGVVGQVDEMRRSRCPSVSVREEGRR